MRTIASAYAHLRTIYGDSNRLRLSHGSGERLALLMLAHADLCRVIRKEQGQLLPTALAQYCAWYMCLAEGLFVERGGAILARAMARKYPSGHCGYCQQNPCACSQLTRSTHKQNGVKDSGQEKWRIRTWQDHLGAVYGPNNVCRGVYHGVMRLSEEIGEIGGLVLGIDHSASVTEVLEQECAGELADVLAWLLAIAHLTGHCLESAIKAYYERGCPACGERRCLCAVRAEGKPTFRTSANLVALRS